jgi:nucleotide-binding universal stress UspA family protein
MTTSVANGAVVVAVDATTHSDAALEWAVRYAAAQNRPLLIVHAAGVPTVYESFPDPVENRHELRILGRRTTDRALGLARQQSPGLEVRVRMSLGAPRDVVMASLDGAHLLVVGSRSRGTIASAVLGSVSVGLSAHAPCPVVVVRPVMARRAGTSYSGRVVVGFDGTETSRDALAMGFELASMQGRGLTVLHAWAAGGVQRELDVAEALADYVEKYPDVEVVVRHVDEPAARELVRASEDAEMVVVGSRSRGDVASVLFGSVSRHVVEHARCPVVVVRRPVPAGRQGGRS